MSRFLVNVDQSLVDAVQGVFKSGFQFPKGWFKEDKNGAVDMSGWAKFNTIKKDASGNHITKEVLTQFEDPNGVKCFDSKNVKIMVSTQVPVVDLIDVYVIDYDHAMSKFADAGDATKGAAVQALETGKWVGIITDPDNHANILDYSDLIQVSV